MSKRSIKMASQQITAKKQKHWSLSLVETVKDPSNIVKQSETAVVVHDKYPKATVHYLILPKDNTLNSLFKLNKTHIDLLKEFERLYEELKSEHTGYTLKAGFHAIPSMQLLHVHVISTDMISPCLKTKQHWNSFTTKNFITYTDIIQELEEKGSIKKISQEEHKATLATPLKCNQCSYMPANMPKLKEHLLSHTK